MKKQILTMAVLAGTIMMTSCSKDAPEPKTNGEAVEFTGYVGELIAENSSNSRNTTEQWNNNEKIGIFMVDHLLDGSSIESNNVKSNNIQYSYSSSSSSFVVVSDRDWIYYPSDNAKVDFIAYAPYVATADMKSAVSSGENELPAGRIRGNIKSNQILSSHYKMSNLLWAKETNGGDGFNNSDANNVELKFQHQMALIVMNIKLVGDDGFYSEDDITAKINNLALSWEFDLKTGTLTRTNPNLKNHITPYKSENPPTDFLVSFNAILPPKSLEEDSEAVVTFYIDEKPFNWPIGNLILKSGYKYTYDITITLKKVGIGNKIVEWNVDVEEEAPENINLE